MNPGAAHARAMREDDLSTSAIPSRQTLPVEKSPADRLRDWQPESATLTLPELEVCE